DGTAQGDRVGGRGRAEEAGQGVDPGCDPEHHRPPSDDAPKVGEGPPVPLPLSTHTPAPQRSSPVWGEPDRCALRAPWRIVAIFAGSSGLVPPVVGKLVTSGYPGTLPSSRWMRKQPDRKVGHVHRTRTSRCAPHPCGGGGAVSGQPQD